MNGIKIIRDYFGLKQQELAVFLEVSNSMLAMAETSKRLLPTHALVKLSLLDAHMQLPKATAMHKAVVPQIKKHTVHYTKQMQALHKELQYKTAVHKRKMDAMQKQYGQAVQTLALVTALRQKNSKAPATKKDIIWLQLIKKKADIALRNTHPVLQAQAQLKIKLLQQEATALQVLLQNQ